MPNMARISCAWQNWPGAPGVTQFYADPGSLQGVVNALKVFWDGLQGGFPNLLTIQVPSSGDLVDDATGQIAGAWSVATQPAVTTCTGVGNYAGNAGAVLHWLTVGLAKGRRIRGRTFLVPLVNTAFDSGGSLSPAMVTNTTLAGNKLITDTAGQLKVWHRPVYAKPKTKPPVIVTPGSTATITSCRVPDLAVSLRSRRV